MNRFYKPFLVSISIIIIAGACSQPAVNDAEIQTAIAQTAAATATFQAAVNQAAQATVAGLPSTPTPGPTVEYYELTEEELSALIDAAVAEALSSSNEANTTTAAATSDSAVTDDEVYATIAYVYDAEAAVAYAEDLLDTYFELYGEYASEALDLLYAIDEDLNTISTSLAEMEAIFEQGASSASAAIDQLNAAVQSSQAQISEAQAQAAEIKTRIQTSIQDREDQFTDLPPSEIAADRDGTINQVFAFLDTFKGAMEDRRISPPELTQIAQLGTNAQASILQNGGPALQNLAPGIEGLTRQAARGEWPTARHELGGFEASLPSRPARR